MTDSYYVISNSDGDVRIDGPLTREQITHRINTAYYGSAPRWLAVVPYDLQTIPDHGHIILCGTVVVPRAVETVVRHELP